MSAVLSNASADFTFGGASIHLAMASPQELIEALAKFGIKTAANDTPVGAAPQPTTAKEKPAATPAPTAAPAAEGNASASTGAQAGAQDANAGSGQAADAPTVTYDQVRDRVLALSKVSKDLALETLGLFTGVGGAKVDHGNKLQLHDYPAFVKAADAKLKPAGVAA